MGLIGRNFAHHHKVVRMLDPQTVTNTSANGIAVNEPWSIGRQLAIIMLGGAFAATVDGAMKLQGQKRSDSLWADLLDKDGNVLQFTAALLDDGGAGEAAATLGTVPLDEIDSSTYKAVRVVFTEAGNAAALIAVVGVIFDLLDKPPTQTDDLVAKLVDTSAASVT